MREIKFRGLRVDGNGWVYGGVVYGKSGNVYILQGNDTEIVKDDCLEVNKETVGQFTGLKDKSGNEIYEGDIVTIKSYNFPYQEKEKFRIVYSQEDMMFKFVSIENQREYDKYGFHSIEIIGNIHENPELCK